MKLISAIRNSLKKRKNHMKSYGLSLFVTGLLSPAMTFADTGSISELKESSGSKSVYYDYDGDGKADVGVRRPSNRFWYIRNSQQNNTDGVIQRKKFGLKVSDIPVSGDFDGDGSTDFAFRRTSNRTWYIINSSGVDAITGRSDGITRIVFGREAGDVPVPADYDGDGKTDIAVYRPSTRHWYILNSSGVDSLTGSSDGISRFPFGDSDSDLPVPADYDGDGKADIAMRTPDSFAWKIRNSSGVDSLTGNSNGISVKVFGRNKTDIAVPADFDGDGKADIAVRRPSSAMWYVLNSSKSNFNSSKNDGIQRVRFGRQESDIPIIADYDGDGIADFSVRRPDSFYQYILNSSGVDELTGFSDGISRLKFGLNKSDIPIAAPIQTRLAMLPCEDDADCQGAGDNHAPQARGQSLTTKVDSALNITLVGTDDDGDSLEYTIVTTPQNGVLQGTAPDLTYIPNSEYVGNDEFTFSVSDGRETSTPATISITITGEDAVNTVPVAVPQSVQATANVPVQIVLRGEDEDGDNLAFELESEPENGSLSGTPPNLTYTPNTDYAGDDRFLFIVTDGEDISEPAEVSINVEQSSNSNSPPVATAQSLSTNRDTALTITLYGTDTDGDTLTYAVSSQPQNGTLSGTAPNLTYTPNTGYTGTDNFTFTVSDGQATSTAATIAISVEPPVNTNTPPVATAQSLSTNMDTALSITLSGTDADGDTLTYTVASQPQNGTLSGTAPNLTYTPNTGYMGTDALTFTVNDGKVDSAPASISINVVMPSNNDDCSTHSAHNMLPDFAMDSMLAHSAVVSGDWSNPATWGGAVPPQGAGIKIPTGVTVNVDSVISTRYETIRVDGTLTFANNVNTQLNVDTLVSQCGALVQIGTAQSPINPDVKAEVIFINDGPVNDAKQIGRGAILMGTTEVHGAAKTHRAIIFPQARSGDSSLTLKTAPSGWRIGDQLIITGTVVNDPKSDEIRTITSINGTQIGLDTPLSLDHVAPKTDLNVYVANATRNIIFTSESQTLMERGHIMFMHTLNVNVNNASFIHLGRTDKTRALDDILEFEFDDVPGNFGQARALASAVVPGPGTNIRGRYPFHMHRGGIHLNRQPALVKGSVVFNSPGWGFVTHSSYADFIDNVTYGVQGTAYYTEAGDEVGTMRGNIAIRTINDTFKLLENGTIDPDEGRNPWEGKQRTDYGHQGDGFWLAGNMVAMIDNVVSGASAHGIIYWVDGILEPDLVPIARSSVKVANVANGHLIPNRESIPIWYAPLAKVSGNEVYNSIVGLRSRYMHTQTYYGEGGSPYHERPPQAYIDTLNPMIDDLTTWNVRDGAMLNYGERLGIKNSRLIGIGYEHSVNLPTTHSVGIGLDMANHVTRGPGRVENVSIENFDLGFMLPTNDQWVIEDMTLNNNMDMWIKNPFAAPRSLIMNRITFVKQNDIRVSMYQALDNFILQPNYFVMPDHITLNGQGLYYDGQVADFVPGIPGLDVDGDNPNPSVPGYFSKTNQQLQNEYGLSFGGRIKPSSATQVEWIDGGFVGPMPDASTVFPPLYDMTAEGYYPEPAPGTMTPEITRNYLVISKGERVTLLRDVINATDTDTPSAQMVYTVVSAQNGYFAHRDDSPNGVLTSFTQAEIDGGVIQFVHDNSATAPAYSLTLTDGASTTAISNATVIFTAN